MRLLGLLLYLFFSQVCLNSALAGTGIDSDAILIMDTSASMGDPHAVDGHKTTKMQFAAKRAKQILKKLANEKKHNVAVISFMGASPILSRSLKLLDSEFEVDETIDKLSSGGGTPLARSIDMAANMFSSSSSNFKSLIIISDGEDDYGLGAVRRSIQSFNSKTDAQVFLFLIADNPSVDLWAAFKKLKDVIIHGTLILIASGMSDEDYDPLFNLTYDSISGSWNSAQTRNRFRKITKDLPNLHADHVLVISESKLYSESVYNENSKRSQVVVDWEKMKANNPSLYGEYKGMLEEIESGYLRARLASSYAYLLAATLNINRVTKSEVLSTHSGKIFHEATQPWSELPPLTVLAEGDFGDKLATSLSLGFGGSSAAMATSSIVGVGLSAISSASVLNETLGLIGLTEEGRLFARIHKDDGKIEEHSSMNLVPSLVLGSSSIGGGLEGGLGISYFSLGSGLSMTSTLFGMDSLNGTENALRSRENRELRVQDTFINTELAKNALRRMFPNLSDVQIRAKISNLKKVKTMEEKLGVLFGHDPELLEMAQASNSIDNLVRSILASKKPIAVTVSGLRDSTELPNHVEAYLDTLRSDLSSVSSSSKDEIEKLGDNRSVRKYLGDLFLTGKGIDDFDYSVRTFLQVLQ